jgi:hypothetical protein
LDVAGVGWRLLAVLGRLVLARVLLGWVLRWWLLAGVLLGRLLLAWVLLRTGLLAGRSGVRAVAAVRDWLRVVPLLGLVGVVAAPVGGEVR